LRPTAGDLAFLLFALGVIGTGLLAIPVLAGSGAYAVSEIFGWPSTLEAKFPESIGLYAIIPAVTLIGLAMGFLLINPIQLLVWTSVTNGIIAAPIMTMTMVIGTNRAVVGRFRTRPSLAWAGWGATALMAITVAALLW
jgi:Mn2+/Fe2+ NRAMP family transporter